MPSSPNVSLTLEKVMSGRRKIQIGSGGLRMSRAYSQFPTGSVGVALILLRIVDGLGLVGGGLHLFTAGGSSFEPISVLLLGLVLIASAALLLLGLRTTFAGCAAAICTIGVALYTRHHVELLANAMDAWLFLFAIVFVLSSSLALLGPGGYSLDARLSGWRKINLSSQLSSEDTASRENNT
jgi:uncharacterized membrane protein YphA (DoxX/SURF4 family)